MANPVFSNRLHPGGSGVYRPSWDTSGASLSIVGTGLHWADNLSSSYAEFASGALPVADFAADTTYALDMAGSVWAYGTGGCVVTLRRISTGAVLATSNSIAWSSGWSALKSATWATVVEDPNPALAAGDLCAQVGHAAGVTELVRVTDLAFSYTDAPPPPAPAAGGLRRGPRVFPLKSQQWTPRRGPGSYY